MSTIFKADQTLTVREINYLLSWIYDEVTGIDLNLKVNVLNPLKPYIDKVAELNLPYVNLNNCKCYAKVSDIVEKGHFKNIIDWGEEATESTIQRDFETGEMVLDNKTQFMHLGKPRKVRFSYTGPSVQAFLARIATARVIERVGTTSIIEAETIGTGINMYLLAQGARVKALEPPEFVEEMSTEVRRMLDLYSETKK